MSKMFNFMVIALFCFPLISCGIYENLMTELGKLSTTYPDNYLTYLSNINASTNTLMVMLNRSQLSMLDKTAIPKEFHAKVKAIQFTKNIFVKIYNLNFENKVGSLNEKYLLVTKSTGEDSVISFYSLDGYATGTILNRYETVYYKQCKRFLFIKKCKTKSKQVLLGITNADKALMENALRAALNMKIVEQLKSAVPKTSLAFLDGSNKVDIPDLFMDLNGNDMTSIVGYNMKTTILNHQDIIYSPEKKYKAQLLTNGQLFIGKSEFNGEISEVEKFGKVYGKDLGKSGIFTKLQVTKKGDVLIADLFRSEYLARNNFKIKVPCRIYVTDAGELFIVDANSAPLFKTGLKEIAKFVLPQEERYYTKNGKYFLTVQKEGVVALYDSDTYANVWRSKKVDDKEGPFILVIDDNLNVKLLNGERKIVLQNDPQINIGIKPVYFSLDWDDRAFKMIGDNGEIFKFE